MVANNCPPKAGVGKEKQGGENRTTEKAWENNPKPQKERERGSVLPGENRRERAVKSQRGVCPGGKTPGQGGVSLSLRAVPKTRPGTREVEKKKTPGKGQRGSKGKARETEKHQICSGTTVAGRQGVRGTGERNQRKKPSSEDSVVCPKLWEPKKREALPHRVNQKKITWGDDRKMRGGLDPILVSGQDKWQDQKGGVEPKFAPRRKETDESGNTKNIPCPWGITVTRQREKETQISVGGRKRKRFT